MSAGKNSFGLHVFLAMQSAVRSGGVRWVMSAIGKRVCLGIVAVSLGSHQALAATEVAPVAKPGCSLSVQQCPAIPAAVETQYVEPQRTRRADFRREIASAAVHHIADWVVDSSDNHRLPFMIIDKTEAKVFVFDTDGHLRGAASALLGLALGDDSTPGIGDRKLSTIRPDERTTPAGRFVAALGRNAHGVGILWIDYDNAISLHRVITTNLKEQREQRLATPSPKDNRISYGCINVPVKFYESVVSALFNGTDGIVYVLPETRSAQEVFKSYDVN